MLTWKSLAHINGVDYLNYMLFCYLAHLSVSDF